MKIILSQHCESLTGLLNPKLGYYIEHRKNGFFSVRNAKQYVPPDGHWRFILLCAQLAQNKLHIADIIVPQNELREALLEANIAHTAQNLTLPTYRARDILNLK